jgi:dTDP-4-dehydrorhamnose 3,5-epimerase
VLEDSIVSYKCAEKFYAEYDDGIFWNDPEIGIDWPLDQIDRPVIVSEKDGALQSFRAFTEKIARPWTRP